MIKKIAYIWLLAAIGIMAACTEDTFVDNRTKVDASTGNGTGDNPQCGP